MTDWREVCERNPVSAECFHRLCSACRFEDCACECHAPDDSEPPLNVKCACGNLYSLYMHTVCPRCFAWPAGEVGDRP
jgi:hypothetical protein